MEAVAVYSDADAGSMHVRQADLAVRLGPPPPTESYLRIDLVVEAALATGADADPSRLWLPVRAGGLRPGGRGRRARLRRAAVGGHRGARGQGPGPRDRAVGRGRGRPRDPRSGGGRPPRPGGAIVAEADRIGYPAAGQGGGRRRGTGDAPGGSRRRPAGRAGSGIGRGRVGIRRRVGLPGTRDPAGAAHRGPAAGRRDRGGRRHRRTRLLIPATPPEADRGGAGTGPVDRRAAPPPRPRRPGGDRRWAPERGDGRVPPGRRGGLPLPRGQHPAPGGAWRDRAGDRSRHRP